MPRRARPAFDVPLRRRSHSGRDSSAEHLAYGRQDVTCAICHAQNPAGARFCNNCGSPLTAAEPSAAERRLVSILFADVVDSTALAEKVDPEEWSEVMNGVIRFIINAVMRYEGTVARLMGDGILAIFGAPVAREDDAERAVLAALAIRDAAAEHAAKLRRSHGFGLSVR